MSSRPLARPVTSARALAALATAAALAACGGATQPDDAALPADLSALDARDASAPDALDVVPDDTARGDTATPFDAPPRTDAAPTDAGPEPALVDSTFTPDTSSHLDPERGWMEGGGIDLLSSDDFVSIRTQNYSLSYAPVRLDAYRQGPIPDAVLARLDAGLTRVRAARIKVILRFVYNDPSVYPCTDTSPTGMCADAAESVVLNHIHQVGPALRAHADVIAAVEEGFIGLWGEGHGSTHALDQAGPRGRITAALLAEVPASRAVLLRTPMMKSEVGYPAALTDAQAFDGSAQSRLGHHNDCFLASDSDLGTYDSPVATWQAYVAQDTRFVPMGGETCGVYAPRTACAPALSEMSRLHWSFLNRLYHPAVISGWQTMAPACFDEITRRLGYRAVLLDASVSGAVRPGGVLTVRAHLRNEGFAAPFNPRPVYAVLRNGATRLVARFGSVDPRRWAGGAEATFTSRFRVPASAAAGTWSLSLWLPDAADTLRDVPEYALRFANTGVFQAATGENLLSASVRVDPAAGGSVDPAAGTFVELP